MYQLYEVKVAAATYSVINPKKIVLGKFSEGKKVSETKMFPLQLRGIAKVETPKKIIVGINNRYTPNHFHSCVINSKTLFCKFLQVIRKF